ncbi:putative transcriptional regulator [Escherichia coli]|nr:transcriptional regulator [Escherichia coli O145:H25 str. 07-3858]GDJ72105.1 phage tail fiber protein [Escherichia coli]GDP92114.1 phage tail fiber protein [Escherichia coli]SQN64569.1 putative transcriptional regulator [Escherichia coli]
MLFKQTMIQFLSLKRVNGMDSIKLLDKVIIYQQQNEQLYPAQEHLLLQCSCPLISRQGLYLKLTLPADVDILAESDNPTHYADGFHCNARSPLQGYAMPFLHSVSA